MSMPHIHTQERSPSPEFIPIATDRPVGIDLEEFLPVNIFSYFHICILQWVCKYLF